jgi:hypothetical protein
VSGAHTFFSTRSHCPNEAEVVYVNFLSFIEKHRLRNIDKFIMLLITYSVHGGIQ